MPKKTNLKKLGPKKTMDKNKHNKNISFEDSGVSNGILDPSD